MCIEEINYHIFKWPLYSGMCNAEKCVHIIQSQGEFHHTDERQKLPLHNEVNKIELV